MVDMPRETPGLIGLDESAIDGASSHSGTAEMFPFRHNSVTIGIMA